MCVCVCVSEATHGSVCQFCFNVPSPQPHVPRAPTGMSSCKAVVAQAGPDVYLLPSPTATATLEFAATDNHGSILPHTSNTHRTSRHHYQACTSRAQQYQCQCARGAPPITPIMHSQQRDKNFSKLRQPTRHHPSSGCPPNTTPPPSPPPTRPYVHNPPNSKRP